MSFEKKAVLSVLGQAYADGLKVGGVLDAMGLSRKDQGRMRRFLNGLLDEGLVERVARGTYALAASGKKELGRKGGKAPASKSTDKRKSSKKKSSVLARAHAPAADSPQSVGRIRVHPAGYGFVIREDGLEDVFIPAKYRGSALDGDQVMVYTWEGFKGTEGRVEEIIARGRAKLTGILEKSGTQLYVSPDDPRIATDFGRVMVEGGPGDGRLGDCVLLELTEYPDELHDRLVGRVAKVIGPPDDPRTEIQKIIICADIPYEMPEEVMEQAEHTPDEVEQADLVDRIDLRAKNFITIDPETARDFDDAICIEDGPKGGPRVWVAVADVSHYVLPNDPLDLEAQIRGVSVYLPDQVIPMLPMKLSAGICSLNPHVDRCAMVVRMDFDAKLKLVDRGFAAAVIQSKDRLDYPGVAAALEGDFRGRRAGYQKWAGTLERLHELAQTLRQRRRGRGTLELDLPEAKVVLDADDPLLVRDVVRSKGTEGVKEAYQLVEEFMIAANESVGAFFESRGLPAVWRVHAPPKEQRVEELAELLAAFGVYVDVEEAQTPLGMRAVLQQIEGKPAGQALSFLVLRSLTQAVYDTENVGHFGLASTEYIHFTSPIRRYPDLLVHRLIKAQLHKEGQASGMGGRFRALDKGRLQELATACSSHERRAVEAEREAVSMYRAYLMREHVGEEFRGRVSGVTHFGAFVEIDEPFVEGLIKIDALGDDFFDFDPVLMELSGRRTGLRVCLGDEVVVIIRNVSVSLRRIELALVSQELREEDALNHVADRSDKNGSRGRASRGRSAASARGRKGERNAKAKSEPPRAKRGKSVKGGKKRRSGGAGVNHAGPGSRRASSSTRKKSGAKKKRR